MPNVEALNQNIIKQLNKDIEDLRISISDFVYDNSDLMPEETKPIYDLINSIAVSQLSIVKLIVRNQEVRNSKSNG